MNRDRPDRQERFNPLPLVTRRFVAWAVEVSLVVASALIPFGIGMYTQSQSVGKQVPLNPVLAVTADAIARTVNLPAGESDSSSSLSPTAGNPFLAPLSHRQVAPLTNLFWLVALVAPLVLTSWQLYLLAKTGSTLPKRWFGVRVVTAGHKPPGMPRVVLREGVGCWGLPLLIAYVLWLYTAAFPSLSILAVFSGLMVLGEGMSARFDRQRRCLHDRLAGTYVLDANRRLSGGKRGQPVNRETSYQSTKAASDAVRSGIALTPEQKARRYSLWSWMRQHPNLTLLLVSLFSMAAVLGTLVGTELYIQTQANKRQEEGHNRQQFLALVRQLSPYSPTTLYERQRAILALGTLNNPQALQFLVDLLGQEINYTLLDSIQQALASSGPKALPYLQRLNQYLSKELESRLYTGTPRMTRAFRAERLQATQRAIAKILVIYSGKIHAVDLSRTNLGQTITDFASFTLVLDKIDLSGIQLRAANLNNASFRGSRFREPREDGRWDTSDDLIADLSDAQMKAADLTGANLSRVLMNRTNLIRATLNQANLSHAHLTGANLSSTQLVGANLREADLTNASLTGANLGEASLSQANLYAARLGRVSALGTQLQFANLTESDWQGADLSQADLSGANLRNADFRATRLTSANFRNAQLENVNLRNADLSLADLRGANLAGADLQGVIFLSSKSAQSDQFIQTPSSGLQSALVEGVDFAKAKNLDPKQLAYICTQGGRHPRCP